jgi:cation:H+ antiporter
MLAALYFAVCSALIVLGGARLARHGDVIAARSGLGRTWFGLVLVASVTSLPELVIGVSSVTAAGLPDVAVGDALGSCVFNLALLGAADLSRRGRGVLSGARRSQRLAVLFGIAMLLWVAAGLWAGGFAVTVGGQRLWLTAPVLLAGYAVAMRALFRAEQAAAPPAPPLSRAGPGAPELRRSITRYVQSAGIVVAAGVAMPFVASGLAEAAGLRLSFVGTLLVAAATSLPEVAVTVTAVRAGMVELAVGNLLGSNLFNLAVVGLDQVLYRGGQGSLLGDASAVQIVPALAALAMSALVWVALRRRSGGGRWIGPALVVSYAASTYAVFHFGE